jgi:hypothetical protein
MRVDVDEVELLEQVEDECLTAELEARGYTVYKGDHYLDHEALERALLADDKHSVYEIAAKFCADVQGRPVLLPVQR